MVRLASLYANTKQVESVSGLRAGLETGTLARRINAISFGHLPVATGGGSAPIDDSVEALLPEETTAVRWLLGVIDTAGHTSDWDCKAAALAVTECCLAAQHLVTHRDVPSDTTPEQLPTERSQAGTADCASFLPCFFGTHRAPNKYFDPTGKGRISKRLHANRPLACALRISSKIDLICMQVNAASADISFRHETPLAICAAASRPSCGWAKGFSALV
jgi:hypothetical protein